MILDKFIDIIINATTYPHYVSKGYDIAGYTDSKKRYRTFKRGQKLTIKVEDLCPTSNERVNVKCSECGLVRKVIYHKYADKCWACNLRLQKGTKHPRYKHELTSQGTKNRAFDGYLRKKYNITIEEYYKILEEQDYCCAICETPQASEGRRFAVDHKPGTKIIRGILCQPCNTGIGLLKENPAILVKAANYIKYDEEV